MSWKGVIFTGPHDDRLPTVAQRMPEERRLAYIDEHNKRYKIVEECSECSEPLIAEELTQHYIDHIPLGDARVLCGMYVRAKPEVQSLFRTWLAEHGD